MATGAGLGGVIAALLPLVGVFAILRERRKKRRGDTAPEPEVIQRRVGAAEMERRMAGYLATSGDGGQDHSAPQDTSGQEYRR